LTDFDKIWHADASPPLDPSNQWNFAISKIKDGGGRHFENLQNHNIAAMERPILMKSGHCQPIKFCEFDNASRRRRPFCKFEKNCNVSTTRRPILTTFSTVMSLGFPDTVCQWNFTNLKIQDGVTHHFEKLKNVNIFATDWPIVPKFDMLISLILWTPLAKKFGDFYRATAMLSAVYAVVCVCVCVCVSVTLRYCIKMAKRRITQITPHDRDLTLVFWHQSSLRNSKEITPYGGDKCRWGGLQLVTFDEKRAITRKR